MQLITGGMGFIGLHTAQALLDMGESCVITQHQVSRMPNFIREEIGKRVFVDRKFDLVGNIVRQTRFLYCTKEFIGLHILFSLFEVHRFLEPGNESGILSHPIG